MRAGRGGRLKAERLKSWLPGRGKGSRRKLLIRLALHKQFNDADPVGHFAAMSCYLILGTCHFGALLRYFPCAGARSLSG